MIHEFWELNPFSEQFTSILQYKSEKTSEFFAASAKESSDRMEQWTLEMHKIAVKTEQETVSMHVITIFTLIFLPGTFLAVRYLFRRYYHRVQNFLQKQPDQDLLTSLRHQTFFSSGILDWDGDNVSWDVRGGAMRLFFYICVPMMLLIIAGWYLLYVLAQRKSRKRMNEVLKEVEGELGLSEEQVQDIARANRGFFARGQALAGSGKAVNNTPGATYGLPERPQEKGPAR